MHDRRGQDDDHEADALRDAELRRREEAIDDRSARLYRMGNELERLRKEVDDIKATINRGKGAMLAIITIGGVFGWLLTWAKEWLTRGH